MSTMEWNINVKRKNKTPIRSDCSKEPPRERHLSPQKPALSGVKGSCHSAPNSTLAEVLNGVSKPFLLSQTLGEYNIQPGSTKGLCSGGLTLVLSVVCWACTLAAPLLRGSSDCRRDGTFGAAMARVGFGASALLAQQIPVMQP